MNPLQFPKFSPVHFFILVASVLIAALSSCSGQDNSIAQQPTSLAAKTLQWPEPQDSMIKSGKSYLYMSSIGDLTEKNVSILETFEDRNGQIWIATSGEGIYVYRDDKYYHLTEADGLIHNCVFAITQDWFGNVWIGTAKGLSKFDGIKFVNYSMADINGSGKDNNLGKDLPTCDAMDILALQVDRTGLVWMGTSNGIYHFDGKKFTHILHGGEITNDSEKYPRTVSQIVQDKNGKLWFNTWADGVFRLDDKTLHRVALNTEEWSSGMQVDSRGNVWIASEPYKVFQYAFPEKEGDSVDQFVEYEMEHEVVNKRALRLQHVTPSGVMWFTAIPYDGIEGGLFRFTPFDPVVKKSVLIEYDATHGIPSNNMRNLIFTKSGEVYYSDDFKFGKFHLNILGC